MSEELIAPKLPDDPKELVVYIPTEEDLRVCPLCRRDWIAIEETEKTGRAYLACLRCEISIWVRDPLLGRWNNIEKEPCPTCNHTATRVFFRSDGYLKYYCPKCKLVIENVDEKKHDKVMDAEVKAGTRWVPKDVKRRIEG